MKPKTLILLAVAGGCGLVAMLGVQQAMQGNQTPVKVATIKVLVALENIDTGMRLTPDNTTFKDIPANSGHADAVQTEADYEQRAAKVPFMAGDIIRKTKLTDPGDWGKSVAIPMGMRVISIPVDDTHTISGLLRPGDRVDVLVTYQGRGERGTTVSKTKTLLEYVEVFATDDTTATRLEDKPNASRAKNVALLLTPEQAGFVILAQRKGSLSLSWRRRGDDELAQTKDVDEKLMEELEGTVGLNDGEMPLYDRQNRGFVEEEPEPQSAQQFLDQTSAQPSPVAAVPAQPMWTVQVYHGNEIVPHQFELNGNPIAQTLNSPSSVNGIQGPATGATGTTGEVAKTPDQLILEQGVPHKLRSPDGMEQTLENLDGAL
ncbi:Flp pilus assembly protein CpaB [Planctomicrobium piriforme]|uniref:Pilus assembly protein CpaB n=1 Tax=Planctomicrobium piriforme TaxID=1576369 RepID=A0A1I3P974_9PLAN|nr:Flp pilus assembly protein CpaB [Planctomicrobium piriforme]SFJ17606.1 pilus assembly protein CpaB [Planctomicrobium piriforme]